MPPGSSINWASLARRLLLLAAVLAGPILMVQYGLRWWVDIPESDEFVTVLHFLSRLSHSETPAQVLGELFAQSNEHRTLTSRLILLGYHELSGAVDFAVLAIIGCVVIAMAIATAALAVRERRAAWLLGILLSLSIFNLQHYENLFCSCASADHFLVVLFSSACLGLLMLPTRAATAGALLLAGLSVFTLTQGLAVLPVGAVALAAQRRWRECGVWCAFAAAAGAGFFYGFDAGAATPGALLHWDGLLQVVAFWITLCGGFPSLGHEELAAVLGFAGFVGLGALSCRGAWRKEPLLMALATTAALSMAIIAAGRAGTDTPVLSSRYLVQSAFFWSALAVAGLRRAAGGAWFGRGAIVVGALALGISFASNRLFFEEARHYRERGLVAARQYDLTGSLAGLKHPIFPFPDQADALLREAAQAGVFTLRPVTNRGTRLDDEVAEQSMSYYVDQISLGRDFVHVRGWLMPPAERGADAEPLLILKRPDGSSAYVGVTEPRLDVARALNRLDRPNTGFYHVVPRSALPPGPVTISLAFRDADGVVFTHTDHIVNVPTAVAATR